MIPGLSASEGVSGYRVGSARSSKMRQAHAAHALLPRMCQVPSISRRTIKDIQIIQELYNYEYLKLYKVINIIYIYEPIALGAEMRQS